MDNYDNSIICDYVTVWIKDAYNNPKSNMDDGLAVWDIPYNAYYFKDRGTVCMMSVVDAAIDRGNTQGFVDIVMMTQSGFNCSTAQIHNDNHFEDDIQDLGVLGCFVVNYAFTNDDYETKFTTPEVIKVLTPARPSTIKVYFFSGGKNRHTLDDEGGHITFKFEYIKPEILQENIYSTDPKPAF
tara:strand:+ start:69 stop:620 length:552 start_codon:yes stop_codon:yes gene_type:complete